MRVYLNDKDLSQQAGRELLALALRICADGKLELEEIKDLWRWLRQHKENSIPAVGYLLDIMTRATADKVIDREELFELHLAIERVIPVALRQTASSARKERERKAVEARKEREREAKRIEREESKKFESIKWGDLDGTRHMPLRFTFSKVAGISFLNDDFSDRQQVASVCVPGEYLVLQHDPGNAFSPFATKVLRTTTQQLGHVPEQLAEILCDETSIGHNIFGLVTEKTGGDAGRYFGINFIVFIAKPEVTVDHVTQYVREVVRRRVRQ